MRKILTKLLLFYTLLPVLPLCALDLKFTSPGDETRSLTPVVSPQTLSVVKDEGGLLRFESAEKMPYSRAAVSPNGAMAMQGDSDVSVTFRFGGEKASFGYYLRVSGEETPSYLVLASIWNDGQGTLRIFKVPPKTQVEDQHRLATATIRPCKAGTYYTIKSKLLVQNGHECQLTAEIVPADGGAASTATATDPDGLTNPGAVHLRCYATASAQKIDVKQVTLAGAKTTGR